MKKAVIIIISIIVVLAAAFIYMNYRSRTLSPPASASLTNGSLTITLDYSAPSVRNRVIFGTKEQKALQPYGEYWRLGANESTEIAFTKNVLFNGNAVKAGRYRIYTVPGADTFEVILNSELGVWGAFTPDAALDVVRTKVPVERLATPTEQFTVSLKPASDTINIRFEWERVAFEVPVRTN